MSIPSHLQSSATAPTTSRFPSDRIPYRNMDSSAPADDTDDAPLAAALPAHLQYQPQIEAPSSAYNHTKSASLSSAGLHSSSASLSSAIDRHTTTTTSTTHSSSAHPRSSSISTGAGTGAGTGGASSFSTLSSTRAPYTSTNISGDSRTTNTNPAIASTTSVRPIERERAVPATPAQIASAYTTSSSAHPSASRTSSNNAPPATPLRDTTNHQHQAPTTQQKAVPLSAVRRDVPSSPSRYQAQPAANSNAITIISSSAAQHTRPHQQQQLHSVSIPPPNTTEITNALTILNDLLPQQQEQLLLADLLYALIGIDGLYIRRTIVGGDGGVENGGDGGRDEEEEDDVYDSEDDDDYRAAQQQRRAQKSRQKSHLPPRQKQSSQSQFTLHPSIHDHTLHESISRFLPICNSYVTIQDYISHYSASYEYGLCQHALIAAVQKMMKEYLVLVAQLEHQYNTSKLTLLRAWYYLQSSATTLWKLEKLCRDIQNERCEKGGKLLNLLHTHYHSTGDTSTRELYQYLLSQSAKPYFRIMNIWLKEGNIEDQYEEFMIVDESKSGNSNDSADHQQKKYEKENLSKDLNDLYWDARYRIREDDHGVHRHRDPHHQQYSQVPAFFEAMKERILTTGKYLNVIRECGREIPKNIAGQSTPQGGNQLINISSHPNQQYNQQPPQPHSDPRHLTFSPNSHTYIRCIDTAYSFSSRLLLQLLLTENNLLTHLSILKRYFLGEQGDFYTHLLDSAHEELNMNIRDVVPGKMKTHLEYALTLSQGTSSSVSNKDMYIQNLSCHLYPYSLVQTLGEMNRSREKLTQGTNGKSTFQLPQKSDLLRVHETFNLSYTVSWPLNLILNKKILTKYQLLFRHLFNIKHTEWMLNKCWLTHQSLKEIGQGGQGNTGSKATSPRDRSQSSYSRHYHFSYGLRQRMLHFFHNLSYYIMIEVFQPAWEEMEAKLKAAKAALASSNGGSGDGDASNLNTIRTVDEVILLHTNFLDHCLSHCLLSHHSLLKLINKLSITALFYVQHAETSINTVNTASTANTEDEDDTRASTTTRTRHLSYDDRDPSTTRRRPLSFKHRQAHIAASSYSTLQSIRAEEHIKFIEMNAKRWDEHLFEFLSALRAKSASQSSDAHFTNLYHRLDYNDWYATRFQQQQTQQHSHQQQQYPASHSSTTSHANPRQQHQQSSY